MSLSHSGSGINQYRNLPSLKYAVNDAREVYRYMIEVNRVPKDHIWLLLDEDATLDRIRSALGTQLRGKAGKAMAIQSSLLCFFYRQTGE